MDEPVVNVYGASVAVCRTSPQQQLAAWLFLKWLTEPAQQARWVRASNYFPVRKSTAAALDEYFAKNPPYRAAYELLEYGKSEPSMAGYQQVRRLIQEAMVEVMEGGDTGRVLKDLEHAANKTLEEY
jgi:ABC-type glycerol-3-phosphate transport system substrate-binding protein